MAGRPRSTRELRKEHDAAEAREAESKPAGEKVEKKKKVPVEKKKKAPVKGKRSKTKALVRKRLLWVVYSNAMKEEGRFPYAEREAADARAADLTSRHKKAYFVQPVKEPLVATPEKESAAK